MLNWADQKKQKKSDKMSEMKLIMERWDKYLVEEEGGEVTIGDFFDAFASYMPSTFSKIVGSSAAKIAVSGGAGLFATIATGGLGAVAAVAAATAATIRLWPGASSCEETTRSESTICAL